MEAYRFYIPDLTAQSERGLAIRLPDEETHHATSVLRLGPGSPIIVFDGQGAWSEARFFPQSRKTASAQLQNRPLHDPEPPLRLTLATAIPKGERALWLVEQASQLNVARIQWLDCDRSVVKTPADGGKMDKFRRLAIESAKQCHRTHLLTLHPPTPLREVLSGSWRKILWLDPHPPATLPPEALATITSGDIVALIGPEGGWSPGEQQFLESQKLTRIRLTPTVLRIETAATAIAALLMSH